MRIRRPKEYLDSEDFWFTDGDGVADVNIRKSIEFHQEQGLRSTVTAIQPSGRFGAMELEHNQVRPFQEKPKSDGGWVNGGFFILSPHAVDYIDDDRTVWEREPLERLAAEGQLAAYKYSSARDIANWVQLHYY